MKISIFSVSIYRDVAFNYSINILYLETNQPRIWANYNHNPVHASSIFHNLVFRTQYFYNALLSAIQVIQIFVIVFVKDVCDTYVTPLDDHHSNRVNLSESQPQILSRMQRSRTKSVFRFSRLNRANIHVSDTHIPFSYFFFSFSQVLEYPHKRLCLLRFGILVH
jgi:hypothetical protein